MAKVKKGAKIDFYKFVAITRPSSEKQMSSDAKETITAVNSQIEATNRLGKTLNSIGKTLVDIKKLQLSRLTLAQKNSNKFDARYSTPSKSTSSGFIKSFRAAKIPGFLESLLGLLGGLFKLFIVVPALKWLGDPKNQKKVKKLVDTLVTVAKFIFDVAKFGVVNTIEGLYKLFDDETSWLDKMGGFLQAAAGLGTLLLGIRWLSNPLKLVTDFGGVLKFLAFNLNRARTGMLARAKTKGFGKAALLLTTVAVAGAGMRVGAGEGENKSQDDPEKKSQDDPEKKSKDDPEKKSKDDPEKKSQGGLVQSLPSRSQGGYINGPQSGYPVSLDGGKSTSFIGHGREYVARKANGGAFVVPLNTPGTKTQPHLTSKRLGEAKSQGYKVPNAMRQEYPVGRSLGGKLPQFSQGGAYLNKVKANDSTSGDNANKQIFLHWSGGHRSNTEFHNGNGYHTFIPASGQPVRKARFGQKGRPYHTYGQNQATSAAIAVSGMNGFGSESASSWGAQAITPNQYKGMAKEAAGLATAWGWKPSDITDKRVRTHYEDYRDRPDWYLRSEPSHYRWDLNRLYAGDPENSGPGKIRKMIKQQMSSFGAKPTKTEDPTRDGSDNRNTAPWNPGLGVLDAVTGNLFDFDGAGKKTPPQPPSSTSDPSKKPREKAKVEKKGTRGSPFWTLAAVAGTEDGDPQAWADVAQSVYNRSKSGKYSSRDIRKLLLSKDQYEPTWKFPKYGRKGVPNPEWHNITDAASAALASGTNVTYMEKVAKALENKTLQQNAAKFVGGRTDFMGGNEIANFEDGDVRRKENMPNNFFGWFVGPGSKAYKKTNPTAAGIPDMTGTTSGTPPATSITDDISGLDTTSDAATGASAAEGEQTRPYVSAFRTPASDSRDVRTRRGMKAEDGNYSSVMSSTGQRDLLKQTEKRNAARTEINDRSQAMIQTAIEAVSQANGSNQEKIAAAARSVQQMMAAARAASSQPATTMIPSSTTGGGSFGGGGGSGGGAGSAGSGRSTAAKLGSAINAVGRIFS